MDFGPLLESDRAQTYVRTLRLKVKPEGCAWLNSAAIETNRVWNWANEVSSKAAQPYVGPRRFLSAYDLDKLAAGATRYFERIGSDTIQRIDAEYATRRKQSKKRQLRWRKSYGKRRSRETELTGGQEVEMRQLCPRRGGGLVAVPACGVSSEACGGPESGSGDRFWPQRHRSHE